jgi:hypothetical protein
MAAILCVGSDVELLDTRAAVLRSMCADVEWVSTGKALESIAGRPFDLVILCHTVKQDEARQIYDATHRRVATAKVLRLARLSAWVVDNFGSPADAVTDPSPLALVDCVLELLGMQARGETSPPAAEAHAPRARQKTDALQGRIG